MNKLIKIFACNFLSIFIIYASSLNMSKQSEVNDLFFKYISATCSERADCNKVKTDRFLNCPDNKCKVTLVELEELIIQTCQNEKNAKGCYFETNLASVFFCKDNSCYNNSKNNLTQNLITKEQTNLVALENKIEKNRQKVLTPKTPQKNTVVATREVKPQSIQKTPVTADTQTAVLNNTKELYLGNCQDKDCKKQVETVFEKLGAKDVAISPETLNSITKEFSDDVIPEELKKIYINNGPYSPEMINYFKNNPIPKNASLKNNLPKSLTSCTSSLAKEDCQWSQLNLYWLNQIQSYFSPFTKIDKNQHTPQFLFAQKLYNEGHRTEFSTSCSVSAAPLPKINSSNFQSEETYPLSLIFSFSKNAQSCKEKIQEKYIPLLEKKLAELGNFASTYSVNTTVSGSTAPPFEQRENILGDCRAFAYIPLKQRINPTLDWFIKNKRVKKSKEYLSVTAKACEYYAQKNAFIADPTQYQEYIFFNGKIPQHRLSSKILPRDFGLRYYGNKIIENQISSPECVFTFKDEQGRNYKDTHDLSDDGSCEEICAKRSSQVLSSQTKYSEISCNLVSNIREVIPASATYNIYKIPNYPEDENKKICQHYELQWSQRPILEFYAKTKEECLGGVAHESYTGISDAESYIKRYSLGYYAFRDVKVTFDNETVLDFKSKAICRPDYYGGVKSYRATRDHEVTSINECKKLCEDEYSAVSTTARESKNWLNCSIRNSANTVVNLLNHFLSPEQLDPWIVISPDDPKTKEEILQNYFKEL